VWVWVKKFNLQFAYKNYTTFLWAVLLKIIRYSLPSLFEWKEWKMCTVWCLSWWTSSWEIAVYRAVECLASAVRISCECVRGDGANFISTRLFERWAKPITERAQIKAARVEGRWWGWWSLHTRVCIKRAKRPPPPPQPAPPARKQRNPNEARAAEFICLFANI
jgi:hypothetical protein